MTPTPHPETELLKRQIEALKEELAILISEYEQLQNFICPNIEAKYISLVGEPSITILRLKIEAQKLKRKIELIQKAINNAQAIDLVQIEKALEKELQKWYEKVEKHVDDLKSAKEHMDSLGQLKDDGEIKRLFRLLSKLLHPDINPNQTEKMKMFWHRVYDAYKNADLAELQAFMLVLETTEFAIDDDYLDNIMKKKDALSDSVHDYIQKIEKIKKDYPYILLDLISDKDKIENSIKLMEKEIATLESTIEQFKYLLNMMGFGDNVQHNYN